MIRITIFLLLLSFGVSAQDFPQYVAGKYRFNDSLQFKKFKNNSALDSVLITDTAGKLKMKKIAISSGWGLTGDSGTTAGTNFVGTTDNVGLMFKTNGVQSGYLDVINQSSSFGVNALMSNTTGSSNAAFGTSAMLNNTSGNNNTAVGGSSLQNNLEGIGNVAIGGLALGGSNGSNNTALGYRSSFGEQTGSSNISVGSYAGQYLDGFSNRVIINSLDRGSDANDTTRSIIYGVQSSTMGDQKLYLNATVLNPYATSQYNTNDSMKVINPTTGQEGYRAIPTGGSSISGLTNNTITKATSSTTIGPSSITDDGTNVGISTTNTTFTPGIIVGFGNSITVGIGASPTANNWLSQVAYALGCTVSNQGLTSSTLEDRVPVDPFGAVNAVDRVASAIPTYSSSYAYLIISYGVNDVRYNGANYTPTNFATDYNTVLSAIAAKGWPDAKIKMLSTSYQDSAISFASFGGNPPATYSRQNSFDSTISAVATANGIQYIDIRTPMNSNSLLLFDGVHPNNAGYRVISQAILQAIDTVRTTDAKFAVNGVTELNNLRYKQAPVLAASALPIGIDSAGNIGISQTLNSFNKAFVGSVSDDNITSHKLFVNGGIKTGGVYVNNVYPGAAAIPSTSLIMQYYSDLGPFSTIYNSDNTRMYIQQGAGGLSINNASNPSNGQKLYIEGNTEMVNGQFRIGNNGTSSSFSSGTGLMMQYIGSKGYINSDGALALNYINGYNVGVATASPTSTLHTAGSFATAYSAKTANYTATISDHTVHFTSGTSTFTFPTAVGVTGRIYVVRNDSGNTLTLATTSSQTINGSAPGTQATGTVVQYQSTGANWITLN